MLKKTLAVLVLAFLAILTVPTSATATGYVPNANITLSGGGVGAPGGTGSVSFAPGSFSADANVNALVTGSANLASTGANIPVLVSWSGVGILLFGAALMMFVIIVRRERQQT